MAKTSKKYPGRPSKYKPEFNKQAKKLCMLGFTDKQLAIFFEVNEDTINEWKKVKEGFSVSLKKGKSIADAEVVECLYKRATGYECIDTKFASFEGKITDREEYIKHYPPDVTAIIYWLNNRQRNNWRNKQYVETEEPEKPKTKEEVLKEIEALKVVKATRNNRRSPKGK